MITCGMLIEIRRPPLVQVEEWRGLLKDYWAALGEMVAPPGEASGFQFDEMSATPVLGTGADGQSTYTMQVSPLGCHRYRVVGYVSPVGIVREMKMLPFPVAD
eukprot:9470710-Pyramimonas_sp.AAC.1